MPGNLPTEFQSNTKDYFSSNDKELRDAIKSVVSRYGFALNSLKLDSTSTGTLDLRYCVFIGDATLGTITVSLPTAATWGDRKVPFITIINQNGPNNMVINAASGDTITGYVLAASSLTMQPGECWEFFPDFSGNRWNAFRKQVQTYKEGTWTPAITSASGAFTTVSATGKYTIVGRKLFARLQILITTNGTAAGNIQFTLPPFPPVEDTPFSAFESDVTGFAGAGYFQAAGNKGVLVKYDGTYLGGNSYRIDIAGTYHIS